MKINRFNLNLNYNFKSKKSIFLFKQKIKKINREFNIYLFNEILYNFKLSILIL